MPRSASTKKVSAIFSLPVEVKEKLFVTVPDGARSRFVATLLAEKLGVTLVAAPAKKATIKKVKKAAKMTKAKTAKAVKPTVEPTVQRATEVKTPAKSGGFFGNLFQ